MLSQTFPWCRVFSSGLLWMGTPHPNPTSPLTLASHAHPHGGPLQKQNIVTLDSGILRPGPDPVDLTFLTIYYLIKKKKLSTVDVSKVFKYLVQNVPLNCIPSSHFPYCILPRTKISIKVENEGKVWQCPFLRATMNCVTLSLAGCLGAQMSLSPQLRKWFP